MRTKKASFRIIYRPEPEGGYTVIVPSLPGCITYGSDMEEAREMAQDAIKAYIESMKKHGEAFCDDSDTFEGMLTLRYA
ncbi:MAG: type II toxin-antitoxin system HicB family antitoxin [Nitrospiraceae bacterium]|nr:type II toxin-antitoxin system HicB family antitoxin [Nitrospiraceae bacterium]